MKKRNIDLLRAERKENAALRTNVKVLVRECELLKSRLDAGGGGGVAKRQPSRIEQMEKNLNRAKYTLDAMAIYLALKYGDNGMLVIPRPDMDLLKRNALTTMANGDSISIIVNVRRKGNINGHE